MTQVINMNYDVKVIKWRKLPVFLINNVWVAFFTYRRISFTNLLSATQIHTPMPYRKVWIAVLFSCVLQVYFYWQWKSLMYGNRQYVACWNNVLSLQHAPERSSEKKRITKNRLNKLLYGVCEHHPLVSAMSMRWQWKDHDLSSQSEHGNLNCPKPVQQVVSAVHGKVLVQGGSLWEKIKGCPLNPWDFSFYFLPCPVKEGERGWVGVWQLAKVNHTS